MGYADKEKERLYKIEWRLNNPEKYLIIRERDAARKREKRRLKKLGIELPKVERKPATKVERTPRPKKPYLPPKERYKDDPEKYRAYLDNRRDYNRERRAAERAAETDADREKRLQRRKETMAKAAREWQRQRRTQREERQATTLQVMRPTPVIRKMGRFEALNKWYGM
jgi:hypothetical protein